MIVTQLWLVASGNFAWLNWLTNASFDPLHLVNTYGAFGSVTRRRYEIVIEGTGDPGPAVLVPVQQRAGTTGHRSLVAANLPA